MIPSDLLLVLLELVCLLKRLLKVGRIEGPAVERPCSYLVKVKRNVYIVHTSDGSVLSSVSRSRVLFQNDCVY